MSEEKKKKTVYKLCPCASYEIEKVESFLCDMALQGLILKESSFFGGVFVFEKNEPKNIAYRLEADKESGKVFSDSMGEPDDEAVQTCKELGWEYITKFGNFHIYASENAKVELNTDPSVQAIAIGTVKKLQFTRLLSALVWFIIYPISRIKSSVCLAMIEVGSAFFALICFVFISFFVSTMAEFIHLSKIRRRLKNGEGLDHNKDWKKGKIKYIVSTLVRIMACVLMFILLFNLLGNSSYRVGQIPLAKYDKTVPFVTVSDFSDEYTEYHQLDNFVSSNVIYEWEDPISPYNAEYSESAVLVMDKAENISLSLYVDYHEAINPWVAKQIAKGYCEKIKGFGLHEEFENSTSAFVFIERYQNFGYLNGVIIQKDNVVIKAEYFTHQNSAEIDMDDFAKIVMEKIESQANHA